jgi:pimeloyl-ACP methyl ester carboxylesterase
MHVSRQSQKLYPDFVSILRMRHVIYKTIVLLFLMFGVSAGAQALTSPFENGRFVLIDGVQLHVRDWKNADPTSSACPVLLVHGFAGSSFSFRELAPALQKNGHSVLSVDLPGYGYSERKPFEGTAAAALWQLIEREQPEKKWCLLGHSMGAKLVGQMAALKPSGVQAIVYADGSPLQSSAGRKKWFARSSLVRKTTVKWVETFYLKEKKFASVLSTAYGRQPSAEEVTGYFQPLLLPNTTDTVFGGYAKKWSEDTKPEQIQTIPSLIVWGEKDTWIKPEVGKTLAKHLKQHEFLLVKGAAHCPIETHFQTVLPAIVKVFSTTR